MNKRLIDGVSVLNLSNIKILDFVSLEWNYSREIHKKDTRWRHKYFKQKKILLKRNSHLAEQLTQLDLKDGTLNIYHKNIFNSQDLDKVLEVEVHCCQDNSTSGGESKNGKDAPESSRDFEVRDFEVRDFGANIGPGHNRTRPRPRRHPSRLPRYVGDHTFTVHKDLFE